jgi:hypothetical protein
MNANATQMDELVNQIARSLVDRPQDVLVNAVESGHSMVLELHVAKEDLGKIIGKKGRTAQALRVLIGAAGAKTKKRTLLEIIDQ